MGAYVAAIILHCIVLIMALLSLSFHRHSCALVAPPPSFQAAIGKKVFARERIAPYRKNVLVKGGKVGKC